MKRVRRAKPKRRYRLPKNSGTERAAPQPKRTKPTYRESPKSEQRKLRRRVRPERSGGGRPEEGAAVRATRGHKRDRSRSPRTGVGARPQEGAAARATEGHNANREIQRLARIYLDRDQPLSRRLAAARKSEEKYDVPIPRATVRARVKRDREAPQRRQRAMLESMKSGSLPESFLRLQTAPIEIGRATIEDPGGVASGTARGVRDTIVGLPGGIAKLVTDPKGAAEGLVEDYKRRYGPLVEGRPEEFRKRIKEEGVAAEGLDALAVAPVAGQAAGSAARTGSLGRRAKKVTTEPRPNLRVSGGKAKKQDLSKSLGKAARQKAVDATRRRVQAKREKKADATDTRLPVRPERGEVAPVFRRTVKRAQRKDVARAKGRAVLAMKAEQGREVNRGLALDVASLSKSERQAFKYAVQLGLPADPKAAARALKRRRGQILRARRDENTQIPRVLRKTNDELPVIESLIANAPKAFTPKLAEVASKARQRDIRVAAKDPALTTEQRLIRRHAPQAEMLRVSRADGEGTAQFVKRVKAEAKRQGLRDPSYFPSEKRPTVRYSNYAVGGTKAVAEDKRYTGKLFRTGREDVRPVAAEQVLARNIKRKHNWNLVADNFDKHAYEWGKNKSVPELLDELDRRGIDESTVAFWNPRKYREVRRNTEDTDLERTGVGEEPVAAGLTEAVDVSAVTREGLAAVPGDFQNTKGWSVVPKAVYDEIHADTRPSGAVGRSLDIAKGKQSRILLGLGNIPWLQFQVVSNALLTGFARTGPVDALRAQRWWKGLTPDEQAAVEPFIGVGPFRGDVQQTKLGAAANNQVVNSYRALKQTAFMRNLSRANPLDMLFRADNAQNNFFRKAVLYTQLKREAYRSLNSNVRKAGAVQPQIDRILRKEPTERIRELIRSQDVLERHGQYVNDMLGDYATYTAQERRLLARNVMFYGFLRFSLKFAFYTMPSKHPVTTGLVGQLGRLNAEEVRALLGGDELPWAFGKLYFTKDGQIREVDFSRANPASNVVTSLRAPKDVMRFLPPAFVAAFDQIYGESSFTGKDFATGGRTRAKTTEEGVSAEERARILVNQALRLAAPYRMAEEALVRGPQGDDSLFGDRPTNYVRKDIVDSIKRDNQRLDEKGTGNLLLEETVPFLPRESRDREIAESLRSRQKPKAKKVKPRARTLDDFRNPGAPATQQRRKTLDDFR